MIFLIYVPGFKPCQNKFSTPPDHDERHAPGNAHNNLLGTCISVINSEETHTGLYLLQVTYIPFMFRLG